MKKDVWSRMTRSPSRRLAQFLLAVTASMTVTEFTEVQQLGVDALRTRFKLPPSCQPSVTALSTDPSVNLITVAIECRVVPPAQPPGQNPGRARPPKGS
jgi:hypothetical protein